MRIAIQLSLAAQTEFDRLQKLNPLVPRAVLLRDCAEWGITRKLVAAEATRLPLMADGIKLRPQPFPPLGAVAEQMIETADEQDRLRTVSSPVEEEPLRSFLTYGSHHTDSSDIIPPQTHPLKGNPFE